VKVHVPGASVMFVSTPGDGQLKTGKQHVKLWQDEACTVPVKARWSYYHDEPRHVSLTGVQSGYGPNAVDLQWPTGWSKDSSVVISSQTVYIEYTAEPRDLEEEDDEMFLVAKMKKDMGQAQRSQEKYEPAKHDRPGSYERGFTWRV